MQTLAVDCAEKEISQPNVQLSPVELSGRPKLSKSR